MEEDRTAQDYIAPLQITKASVEYEQDATTTDETVASEEDPSLQPRFQNFLRASYPFQPSTIPSPSTVTLGLSAGDIVLVHSIHTNGWADGTLLETGARGWLPTNYCEPYDYATMRPLLKAVTEFWDIIRSGGECNAGIFQNHDYMRGMVAGVRFLLEKSDCLTRDSALVKQEDNIRRIRKSLLADLSILVKGAKKLQEFVIKDLALSDIDEVLDNMLLKAFQVVTRAVRFFDCWSEEVTFTREILHTDSMSSIERQATTSSCQSHLTVSTVNAVTSDCADQRQSQRLFLEDSSQASQKRPVSISSRRLTLTHRMSYTSRVARANMNSLASEKLNAAYDAFLGVLASFLGSHMQSRSSSELLLTTQQAMRACRRLLNIVEVIVIHDPTRSEALVDAKNAMYDRITDLVVAARAVFQPLQMSEVERMYAPSEGIQLVSAATACVSGAGRCVAKARVVLEDTGDFEMESLSESDQISPTYTQQSQETFPSDVPSSPDDGNSDGSDLSTDDRLKCTATSGPLVVDDNTISLQEDSSSWTAVDTPSDQRSLSTNSLGRDTALPNHLSDPQLSARYNRPFMRDIIHSTGSQSTLVSSTRDSGPSFVSVTSTRATSPDRNMKPLPLTPGHTEVDAESQAPDDMDEDECEIMESHYAHELLSNVEGRVLGGTLNAIIERLTAHDSTPDAFFVSTVYLTFRLFTTPQAFAESLIFRFKYVERTPRITGPVRLRVYNILKGWLESHWRHECDEPVLPCLMDFARSDIVQVLPSAANRLLELTETLAKTHQPPIPRVLSIMGKTHTSSTDYVTPDQPLPPAILSRSQLASLRSWRNSGSPMSILDFDPLEIARQITIKESALFCSVLPEELLATEFTKQSNSLAVNVRAMAQLSTDLANLVADSVLLLEEPKKRAATIKHWIKVANKCLELNNYDTLMAIVCSINSSTILRLKKTWDMVGQKTKNCFEGLKKVVDVSKNYSTLRQRISGHVPPCLPFVGMYLTDLTFVDHGNPATRELKNANETISVINVDKHMKTAKIISDLQRFQTPYRLTEVPELQTWFQDELIRVRAAGERNFQDQYRRSLVLEPRESSQSRPTTIGTFASIASKDKFDFLAWTHLGKDKPTFVGS